MRWIPAPDFVGGDGFDDDGAGGDDGVVAQSHAFADDGVGSDEDMIADHDGRGLDVVAGFASAGADDRVGGVEVGVEDLDAAADHHVAADRHRVVGDDRGVRHADVVADGQHALGTHENAAAKAAYLGVGLAGADVEVVADRRLPAQRDIDAGPTQRLQAAAFHAVEPEEHARVGGPVRGRQAQMDRFAGFECGNDRIHGGGVREIGTE